MLRKDMLTYLYFSVLVGHNLVLEVASKMRSERHERYHCYHKGIQVLARFATARYANHSAKRN